MKILYLNIIIWLSHSMHLAYAETGNYRLTLRSDPSTTIVIGWDQLSGSNPVVHFGSTDHGTNWDAYSNTADPSRVVKYKGMNNHFARITGLTPNTNYYFVIRDSEGISQRYWFRTAPNTPDQRLSFIAGGDSRNNRLPRQNANRLVRKLKPHAVFFGGDMTDNDSELQWQNWFTDWQFTIARDGRMFPVVAARGNHEASDKSVYNLFDVPSPKVYYALNFGGSLVRTYTLNTETSISGSQTSWLISDLQAAKTTWKFAQYHKPMRPHVSAKREGNSQYAHWAMPFYNYGVNLVVECDSHTVKTTWPIKPSTENGSYEGFIRDDYAGTIYVGEGCWGAPLRTNDDSKVWTRNSGRFNQFKWIFVDQTKIEVRTVMVDNEASVGEVSNSNPFVVPSDLNIWDPGNGAVVTILREGTAPLCKISDPNTGQYYGSPQEITISAEASSLDASISYVEFFVNNFSIGKDDSPPYSMTYSIPSDGSFSLEAVATDNKRMSTSSSVVNINVGAINQAIDPTMTTDANSSNQNISVESSTKDFMNDGLIGSQIMGLRFTDVNVPQGANINNAYIQFIADGTNYGIADITIRGEIVDNASSFSRHITTTSTAVHWTSNEWKSIGDSGIIQITPDLSSVVQEIVDGSGWITGNDLSLVFTGSGERIVEAAECTRCVASLYLNYKVNEKPSNQPPICSVVSPISGSDFSQLQPINISASASDADGSISQVEFFVDGNSVGIDTSSPYSVMWTISSWGTHAISAKAKDNQGSIANSATTVVIARPSPNNAPEISITTPSDGTYYDSLQNITIASNASDVDGSVSKVEFFINGKNVGLDTVAPYSVAWSIPSWGDYDLTAIATDNKGAETTSSVVSVSSKNPNSEECTSVLVDFNDLESGWGIWNDGGSDCSRVLIDSAYANDSFSIMLRDNSSTSYTQTDRIDLSEFNEVKVGFSYYAVNMDHSDEDFLLQISNNDGESYNTIKQWNYSDEFFNNKVYNDSVTIQGPLTSQVRFRFVCDASSNNDLVYIDNIRIGGCINSGGTILSSFVKDDGSFGVEATNELDIEDLADILVYPNPAKNEIMLDLSEIYGSVELTLFNIHGKPVLYKSLKSTGTVVKLDVAQLASGVYILGISAGDVFHIRKVAKK